MDISLLQYFLPEQLLEHFSIIKIEEKTDPLSKKTEIYIAIEEKNILPIGYSLEAYESKGFMEPVRIQDFPIRGKAVYLLIKRRRWRNKENKNESISNDYSFIAEGAGLTTELSDFLKATGRYSGRHDK